MEEINAWQAVRNNAYGTRTLARAAAAARVEKFVLVSTDKAVNPTNVMGASKRLAEMVCQSLQNGATQFVIVRFGNVFGSAGSVIPRFREQIARGGPVTVTHPEITRYFMSSSEATQLLLQAGLMGRGGEVLVLDMGEPVKIVDLARDMIRLSGGDPDQIRVVFTGLRPGEKLYEEPLASGETTLPTPHPKLRIAQALLDIAKPSSRWSAGSSATATGDAEVRAWLQDVDSGIRAAGRGAGNWLALPLFAAPRLDRRGFDQAPIMRPRRSDRRSRRRLAPDRSLPCSAGADTRRCCGHSDAPTQSRA
jgi:FlaA1/EpsC-like NDP-sugar epimerase